MTHEIIIAGFGGQGVLLLGKLLAQAAGIVEGREITWMPAYGPEQRGGTSNVTVILSDDPISSPVLSYCTILIALNQPSLDKFEPVVKKEGILLYETNGIRRPPERTDIHIASIGATQKANELKQPKVMNMIVLGALLKLEKLIAPESIEQALKGSISARNHHLIPLNMEAIQIGGELVEVIS